MDNWNMTDWVVDDSGAVRRVEMPEAGGWMYMFRGGDASYNHVFVPNMSLWIAAMSPKVESEPMALLPAPEPEPAQEHAPESTSEHQPENS